MTGESDPFEPTRQGHRSVFVRLTNGVFAQRGVAVGLVE